MKSVLTKEKKKKMMGLKKKLEIFSRIEAVECVSANEHVKNLRRTPFHEKGGLQGTCFYSSLDLMLKLLSSKRGPLTVAHKIDFANKD
jgi:hypothetical protein